MDTTEDAWDYQEICGRKNYEVSLCLLDLRRRVEALERRAATEESSAPEPAPAADRPLWEVMAQARYNSDGPRMGSVRLATAAEIDAVADWLAARGCAGSADLLRAEARRAREGA